MASDLGDLKKAIKKAKNVYVWANVWGDEGEYLKITKKDLLRSMNADTPNDGAYGGRPDETPTSRYELDADGDLFISCSMR
jgi:hypothetical protein